MVSYIDAKVAVVYKITGVVAGKIEREAGKSPSPGAIPAMMKTASSQDTGTKNDNMKQESLITRENVSIFALLKLISNMGELSRVDWI
ncbi:MAG: hypothetical protein LBP56_09280 [Odoribacteraceae bacterium]|jgi:hypothetical protein|nr:hypothetical protein [Odoribacteraceae bacterium]